jgi:hypothetical protein
MTTPESLPDPTPPRPSGNTPTPSALVREHLAMAEADARAEADTYRTMVSVLLAQGHALLGEYDLLQARYARLLADYRRQARS